MRTVLDMMGSRRTHLVARPAANNRGSWPAPYVAECGIYVAGFAHYEQPAGDVDCPGCRHGRCAECLTPTTDYGVCPACDPADIR